MASSGAMKKNVSVDEAKNRFVHHIIINVPLTVKNYIPKEILLTTDSGGVNHTMTISEVCDELFARSFWCEYSTA